MSLWPNRYVTLASQCDGKWWHHYMSSSHGGRWVNLEYSRNVYPVTEARIMHKACYSSDPEHKLFKLVVGFHLPAILCQFMRAVSLHSPSIHLAYTASHILAHESPNFSFALESTLLPYKYRNTFSCNMLHFMLLIVSSTLIFEQMKVLHRQHLYPPVRSRGYVISTLPALRVIVTLHHF